MHSMLILPRERLRSIVMSTFVCVCLSVREDISGTANDLYQFSVHVAYGCRSVPLRRRCDTLCTSCFVDDMFFYNGPYSGMNFATEDRFRLHFLLYRKRGTMCYVGVTIPEGEGQFLGKHLPDKPNTHNNCELHWSM